MNLTKSCQYLLILAFAVACPSTLVLQAHAQTMDPPKVIAFTRELVKPGKTGAVHDKSESQFVQAMANAKWPTHYLGLNSLTGVSRAVFLIPYDSFDAMEKDNAATMKNKTLASALDHASVVDGDLLASMDSGILTYDEAMSYKPAIDISQMRFLEVTVYQVKPGKRKEWSDLVKMVKGAYDKAALGDVTWAVFDLAYGGDDGAYFVFTWHKSLAEIDHGMLEGKDFDKALGADGLKKLDELYGETVASANNQLFAVNPNMSYVPESWTRQTPAFWKMPSASKASAKKPTP